MHKSLRKGAKNYLEMSNSVPCPNISSSYLRSHTIELTLFLSPADLQFRWQCAAIVQADRYPPRTSIHKHGFVDNSTYSLRFIKHIIKIDIFKYILISRYIHIINMILEIEGVPSIVTHLHYS
jgi:hypothetical protein